jgi:hypothetical protein
MSNYTSPTTPGLAVDFKQYITELLCQNTSRASLKPRFWKKHPWGKKYGMEIMSVNRLIEQMEIDIEDPLWQKAILQAIEARRTRSLMSKRAKELFAKDARRRYKAIVEAPSGHSTTQIDQEKNARFVESGRQTKVGALRRIERGKEATES